MLEKIIRIPNKSFDNLTREEIALMIEADSSLSSDGNEYFSSCALDEFLSVNYLENEDIRRLQRYIQNNIYVSDGGERNRKVDTAFLKNLVIKLREGHSSSPAF